MSIDPNTTSPIPQRENAPPITANSGMINANGGMANVLPSSILIVPLLRMTNPRSMPFKGRNREAGPAMRT